MTLNPEQFQDFFIDKKKFSVTNIPLIVDNEAFKSVPSVELLGIHLDMKFNFVFYT